MPALSITRSYMLIGAAASANRQSARPEGRIRRARLTKSLPSIFVGVIGRDRYRARINVSMLKAAL